LKLLVDASLEVLVQQCFEFFILLVQKTSLFNEILTVDEELVVFSEGVIERSPDRELLVVEDLGHLTPVDPVLLLFFANVTSLVCGL